MERSIDTMLKSINECDLSKTANCEINCQSIFILYQGLLILNLFCNQQYSCIDPIYILLYKNNFTETDKNLKIITIWKTCRPTEYEDVNLWKYWHWKKWLIASFSFVQINFNFLTIWTYKFFSLILLQTLPLFLPLNVRITQLYTP